MLKKAFLLSLGMMMTSACSANNESIAVDFSNGNEEFFNSILAENHTFKTVSDYNSAKYKIWFEPISVKHNGATTLSIDSCYKLLEGDGVYSEAQPNQFVEFQYLRSICHAIDILSKSKSSEKSFFPKNIISKDSPKILPKEFIPIYSNSQVEEINAMPNTARWSAGVSVNRFRESGTDTGIFYQTEQDQVLTEFARADFNNDGIEDALLYLRTKVNGGSHETNKIFVVTAGEDGLIKTLSVFPEDD